MTTQQKDRVIDTLTQYLEAHPDSDTAKFMLYANPNGSGLVGNDPKLLPLFQERLAEMRTSGEFDPTGMELPLKSLGLESRVRHTIDELITRLEIANLMRAHIFVANAKGQEWPPKPLLVAGAEQLVTKEPSLKIPAIKAVKALARKALVDELPTIIRLCYTAKFKSSGTFAYSIAEVKPYTIAPAFLKTCLEWVSTRLGLGSFDRDLKFEFNKSLPNETSLFHLPEDKSREKLLFDSWFRYSYSKSRDTHSYPECYDKLCKNICARVGKLMFTAENAEDYDAQKLENVKSFLQQMRVPLQPFLQLKKKDFQAKLYALLLSYVSQVYMEANSYQESQRMNFIIYRIDEIITSLSAWLPLLDIDESLVFIDIYKAKRSQMHYTVGEFKEVVEVLNKTGVCNDRIINAIYRFISITSLLDNDHSRKTLAFPIEKVLIDDSDLSKIRSTASEKEEYNLVFSKDALEYMSKHKQSEYGRFAGLYDKKHPGTTGYVQKGVMSITSALKMDNENYTLPYGTDDANFKLAGNKLDEMANIYAELAQPRFDEREKNARKEAAERKLREKHGIPTGYAGSPSMTSHAGAFVPPGVSPSQHHGVGMFTHEVQQPVVPMFGTVSSAPVSPPAGLFGAAPVVQPEHVHHHVEHKQPSPLAQPTGGLFAATQDFHTETPSPLAKPTGGLFASLPSQHEEKKSSPLVTSQVSPLGKQGSGLFGGNTPVQSHGGLFNQVGSKQSSPVQVRGTGLFGDNGSL